MENENELFGNNVVFLVLSLLVGICLVWVLSFVGYVWMYANSFQLALGGGNSLANFLLWYSRTPFNGELLTLLIGIVCGIILFKLFSENGVDEYYDSEGEEE